MFAIRNLNSFVKRTKGEVLFVGHDRIHNSRYNNSNSPTVMYSNMHCLIIDANEKTGTEIFSSH